MKLFCATRSLAIAGSLFCSAALAQTRICIGGDLDHLTQAERNTCTASMTAVRAAAATLHAPEDWHFVVVCGEKGWKEYAAYSAQDGSALLNASVDTNLEQHETFLRADRVAANDTHGLKTLLAHEIAGLTLHAKDQLSDKQVSAVAGRTSSVRSM